MIVRKKNRKELLDKIGKSHQKSQPKQESQQQQSPHRGKRIKRKRREKWNCFIVMSESEATAPIDVVTNANAECIGPTSELAGKSSACAGCPNQSTCASGAYNKSSSSEQQQDDNELKKLQMSLGNVSHVLLILSGKGGVGKSTMAAQLCHTLSATGYAVGLLDIDLCGPSAPRMILGDQYKHHEIRKANDGSWLPVYSTPSTTTTTDNGCTSSSSNNNNCTNPVAVMSISFLLPEHDQAVVWRGPRKNALIQQFLSEVNWTGTTDGLDYLIIDTPPGTSDEHISTIQYLQKAQVVAGAILVTTPEEASLADVRKELSFCIKTNVPILGIIENMGTFQSTLLNFRITNPTSEGEVIDCTETMIEKIRMVCPELLHCVLHTDIFPMYKGGGEQMALEYQIPFWGRVPLDPLLCKACENGQPFVSVYPQSNAAQILLNFCTRIQQILPVDMSSS